MIKYKIFLIFSALVLFILSGCATVIKDFDAYQNAGAPRSPNAPSGKVGLQNINFAGCKYQSGM